MSWEKQIVRRTLEGAGEYPGVQLQLLLQRLEHYPDALPAIADAVSEMGDWFTAHAAELEAETRRRKGGADVLSITGEGGK